MCDSNQDSLHQLIIPCASFLISLATSVGEEGELAVANDVIF